MKDNESCNVACSNAVFWWAKLVIAVLAVPSFGFLITRFVRTEGFLELVVFIIACWVCTYLGMKLMEHPSMQKRIGKDD